MHKKLNWLVAAIAATAFIWAFWYSHGNLAMSLNLAAKFTMLFIPLNIYLKRRREKKESGLSIEQFELKKAGGAIGLQKKAQEERNVALFLAALPFAAFVLSWAMSSVRLAFILMFVFGGVFFPVSAAGYLSSRRLDRIAREEAEKEKIMGGNKEHLSS